jgi:ATP-dependent DNA helicase RecQ
VLLFNHADVRLREYLIETGSDGGRKPDAAIAAERERLRAIMAYAYARSCRRAFLLDYFGDEVKRCGGVDLTCDNCAAHGSRVGGAASDTAELALARVPISDEDHLLVRKVLSCVARVDGGFGRNRIALCLEGSTAKEVADGGLHRLSTYGVLRGRSHAWVLDVLGTLEAAGLLATEGDDYPCLRLTLQGRQVMLDRARMSLPLPAERSRVSRPSPVPSVALAAAERGTRGERGSAGAALDPEDAAMFESLRGLRTQLAATEKLPAYCILHDRTLAELARTRPRSLEALATVPGIGPAKLAKYGGAFLSVLNGGEGAGEGATTVSMDELGDAAGS